MALTPEQNRDEIIAMAREAGCVSAEFWPKDFAGLMGVFERFAALVAAKEREMCAQVAMEFRRGAGDPVCGEVAVAIRARSKP